MPHRITGPLTFIICISFYGVDRSVRYPLHNSNMVRFSVPIPVEEYNISGFWSVASVPPPFMLLKPGDSLLGSGGKFGKFAVFRHTSLNRTPGNKTGAPIYMGIKAIPAPVWFASHISQLGHRNRHNISVFEFPVGKQQSPHTLRVSVVPEELMFLLAQPVFPDHFFRRVMSDLYIQGFLFEFLVHFHF